MNSRKVLVFGLLACGIYATGCSDDSPDVSAPEQDANLGRSSYGNHPQWYTIGWYGPDSYVQQIDTTTGHGTLGAVMDAAPGITAFGLTFDLDATCYTLVAFPNGNNGAYLARFDLATGATEPINVDTPYDIVFNGPDIDSHGNLYACGFTVGPPEDPESPAWWGGYELWRINKTTGALTDIGDTRVGTGGEFGGEWMDLAFDSQDRCWTTCRNKLFLLDTTDGHSTFVTDITGIPTDFIPGDECPDDWQYMEVMNIAFDENDVLWGSCIRGFSPCTGYVNSPVVRIDTTTGQATIVGYAGTGGQNHGGDIKPTEVTVAHRRGNGRFVNLRISMAALPAHLAHGDYVPGTVGDPNYGND